MTPTGQQTTPRLENRKEAVLTFLRSISPEARAAIDEYLLIDEVLKSRGRDTVKPYVLIGKPRKAVLMLMAEIGGKLTKGQIFTELNNRGYATDSISRKGAVNNAINRLVDTGELVRHNDDTGIAMLVGLAATPKK